MITKHFGNRAEVFVKILSEKIECFKKREAKGDELFFIEFLLRPMTPGSIPRGHGFSRLIGCMLPFYLAQAGSESRGTGFALLPFPCRVIDDHGKTGLLYIATAAFMFSSAASIPRAVAFLTEVAEHLPTSPRASALAVSLINSKVYRHHRKLDKSNNRRR